MARGHWWNEPPWWAWVAMAVGAAVLIVGLPIAVGRGQLSQAEVARLEANQPVVTVGAPTTAPEPPAPPVEITWPDGRPLRVLFAGDSLTKGSFSSDEETLSFRSLVTARLAQAGPVEPTRIGTSGATVIQILPEVAPAGAFDVVIVELGTNDVTLSTPPQFAVDYPQFLDAVRAVSPDAVLICAGAWNNIPAAVLMDDTIKQECEARDGRFVSLRDAYADPRDRGPEGTVEVPGGPVLDDFHPNNAGHAAIAAALLAAMTF